MADEFRIRTAIKYIEENPEEHDQMQWGKKNHCGTTMCLAGIALTLFAPKRVSWEEGFNDDEYFIAVDGSSDDEEIVRVAGELLDLTETQRYNIFHAGVCANHDQQLSELKYEITAETGIKF